MKGKNRYAYFIEKDHARIQIITNLNIVREILVDLEMIADIRQKQFTISFKGKHVIIFNDTVKARYLAHYVLGIEKPFVRIKYKNGNFCDLRKRNLAERKIKAPANKKSNVKGVIWSNRASKWEARITHKKELYLLGSFEDEQLAISAVIMKRIQLLTSV